MKKPTIIDKIDWIMKYIRIHPPCVDILNLEFIDDYIKNFNAKHKIMPYGANKCSEISRVLKAGYEQGIFARNRTGILTGYLGMPKWVYTYTLIKNIKKIKFEVDSLLDELWRTIGIDKPENHYEILDFCIKDIKETADPLNWNNEDLLIAFRRFLESKSN